MSHPGLRFIGPALLLVLGGCWNGDNSTEPDPAGTDANLASLAVSEGTLTPAFSAAVNAYTAEVDNAVASVTVTAAAADANASVDVAGSGAAAANVALDEGDNDITVVVTAEDGATTNTYTVAVTRLAAVASDNADLAGLAISAGSLDQIFQPTLTDYTATVGFPAASTTVTATVDDGNATLTVAGVATDSGAASAPIDLAEGLTTIQVVVTAEDGATTRTYTIEITRSSASAFAQTAYIKSSSSPGDFFGQEVVLDGDTLAVGVKWEDSDVAGVHSVNPEPANNDAPNAGAVYVFVRDGIGEWSLQAYIKPSNPDSLDFFGRAVALSGDTLAVGAYGEASGATGVDGDQADNSADLAGAVYVFTRAAGAWTQQAYIKASNAEADDQFGSDVALDGDLLVATAINEDSSATGVGGDEQDNAAENAGAAYVFTGEAGVWTQQAYLKASNSEAGDLFGRGAAISGDTIAVSAEREASGATGIDGDQADNSTSGAGAVYIFTQDEQAAWTQQAYVKSSNTALGDQFGGDQFGAGLALDGDTLAVGARGEDSAATGVDGDQGDNTVRDAGAVYVFSRVAGAWSQQAYIKASNPGEDDWFGAGLDLEGDVLVVGGMNENSAATGINGDQGDDSAPVAGAAYLFERSAGAWAQTAYLKGSNTESPDKFGTGVAVTGGMVAVGAEQEASLATGINGDQANNSSPGSGAVYVFE